MPLEEKNTNLTGIRHTSLRTARGRRVRMSIEKDIRFIAESIEWQNKLLAKLLLEKETDNDECECREETDGKGKHKTTNREWSD